MTKTTVDTKKIVKQLMEAKKAYYAGKPIMEDSEFDSLEDELRNHDPENKYFELVGVSGNTKTKIKHEVPMLSAGKAKTPDEVLNWLEKIDCSKKTLILEPKIDGLSCACVYKDGNLVLVKTRGDGHTGQDITHIAKYVNIPAKLKGKKLLGDIEVRGELYLPKNNTYAKEKLRNVAVGLVNRKDHDLEDLKHVHFVAYQVIGSTYDLENNKIAQLELAGFEVIQFFSITGADVALYYKEYLDKFRNCWPFETDGIILVVDDNSLWGKINSLYEVRHHNHYNIALKPPSEGKETTLLGIEWNVSRQGKLIPVALVSPVVLGGATVQRCTLNNYGNVLKMKLHKGDRVIIELANDVIPFFKESLTPHNKFDMSITPKYCPSCGKSLKIEGIHIVCRNVCEEQEILKIVHWVKNCEMEAFSEASVRALFNAKKIKTIQDLYNLKTKDFDGVDGFGPKKTENAIKQIEATKSMNIRQFVDRLGIDLVGERAMEKLGIKDAKSLLAFKDTTYTIGENLVEFIKDNEAFVKELLATVDIVPLVEVKAGKNGKIVCMTGFGPKNRNELLEDIKAKGDVFIDRVTKDVNILICEDINGGSTKLEKARKMGVKLVSYSDYFK
jgi:DNA ligase (NAD+)